MKIAISLFILLIVVIFTPSIVAQVNTAFNFQGRLNDGSAPANGRYDLRFRLYDAPTGGGQVGLDFERFNVQLINGVFGTAIDFGPNVFEQGLQRFLEISLRPSGSPNAYIVLGGRQAILTVPYSIKSIYSAFAGFATGATNATNATNSQSLGGIDASLYARLNSTNKGTVSATNLAAVNGLAIGGNAIQPVSSYGFVKAMVEINGYIVGDIVRCYNGVTGSTSGTCGFTLSASGTGVYNINFNMPINNRFIAITPKYNSSTGTHNIGANYRFSAFNNTTLDVFTFAGNNADDTIMADFMVIVF